VGQSDGPERQGRVLHHPEVSPHFAHISKVSFITHGLRLAPLLEKKSSVADPSRVIVTGSVAGIGTGSLGSSGSYSYAASKAAVLHLARNLAVELGPRHILVNGIAPGFFMSKMAAVLMERSGGEEELNKSNPNGRVGKPEDIAAAVVFLSSRAGGHVNGDTLVLDGGKIWGSNRLERL
jgi:NAD(P)-dependent dehydrogenase (short-subunit alcohol dehydrogenase family)